MYIPPKILITTCIEQGSIYHYNVELINRDGSKYKGDRFFIVLNVNPKTDQVLILVTPTTKIANQQEYIKRVGEDSDTLVTILPSDFRKLSTESVVNCNSVHEKTLSALIESIEEGGKTFFDKLPRNVVDSLVRGVLKSKQVSNEHKELLI